MAGAVAVHRARDEGDRVEDVDDLVLEALRISRKRSLDRSTPVAERGFEALRSLRLQAGISDERSREEAEQVEKGRLRDTL
jgi:hypothetical protein